MGPLLMVEEKSFPLSALYCDSGKRYRSTVFCSGQGPATSKALCDGTHTKLQLILQLEHTKRGAKAPLFLSVILPVIRISET
jgi:hypothetical protein